MCGICGTLNLTKDQPIDKRLLERMILALHHRGPDDSGTYQDEQIGIGHARLSIIDLAGGHQPIHNEDQTLWITFNGEIFNYLELREELLARGHRFYTRTDTEIILHLYEEKGPDCLSSMNGQFALAIWDSRRRQLLLARDRLGIRPLFYTVVDGSLIFASEVKSIFMDGRVRRALDPYGLDQLFTFWATLPPRTVFQGIHKLPPGCYLLARGGETSVRRYWDPCFPPHGEWPLRAERDCAERLLELLLDSIRLRLRADVPVAAYLSGGLDSSLITALVRKYFSNHLQTFSVSFADKDYDESPFQRQMADFLGTDHQEILCTYPDIGRLLPQIVWHAEKPLIRTAPAPLYLLSRLVRQHGIKVVLTGEGADEVLAGYDLFKEMKIRRFWAQYPDSKWRSLLLKSLYPYMPNWPTRTFAYLQAFYRAGLLETSLEHYSHLPRWTTTGQVKRLFSSELKARLQGYDAIQELREGLDGAFRSWDPLSQAQYIEMKTLLSGNLLSSQGDRMMMANSVEGRFPFLDYRVVEFCCSLPPTLRLKALTEKYLLKKVAGPFLPADICRRSKQAYRAPDSASLFNGENHDYVEELLSPKHLAKTGYFDSGAVANLVKKCRKADSASLGARDNMAIVGILSTLLLDQLFIKEFRP